MKGTENTPILYSDCEVIVAVKPGGILSTDEPGGFPSMLREELDDPKADIRTVHRLDRAVSGLMVLARGKQSASYLSRQIREGEFEKQYMAVIHGNMPEEGELKDLLRRDKARKMTFIAESPGKDVQEAALHYRTVCRGENKSLVHIRLYTGRTHQIRVQFASRGFPLFGERKYCPEPDDCPLALWSCLLSFRHPKTGKQMTFSKLPPDIFPWSCFEPADRILPCNEGTIQV